MFENLRKLYLHYGGFRAMLKSGYFWVSFFLTLLSHDSIAESLWTDNALGIMPSLTGFTIAAFAIIFAILDPDMLRRLMAPDSRGKSPMAGIAASIGHAVFVQVSAMTLAVASERVDLSGPIKHVANWLCSLGYSSEPLYSASYYCELSFSALGMFLTYYGLMLVLAAILSIFRMQLIVAGATKSAPNSGSETGQPPPPPSPQQPTGSDQ